MSGYLWKYFLEDDVDSFRHVLDNSAHAVRPGTQKSFASWQGGSFGATMNSSPGSYTQSPGFHPKGRKTPAHAPLSLTRSDINSRDSVGLTILHRAASSTSENALNFAQALLEHPLTDLYIQDAENGWTSLHRALYFGNVAIARSILDRDTRDIFGHGSSNHNQHARGLVKIKDKEGYGPLDLYSLTIKDRTMRAEGITDDDSQSDDEVAQGDSGDIDEESGRHAIGPRILLKGDEVSTFGSNKNVTLGFGDEDDRQFPERIVLRRPDHLLQRFYQEHRQVRSRSREFSSIARQDASNSLPKAVSDLPVHIRNTPIIIQDTQMSKLHTAILTTDPVCNLYMCGHGPGGRLGTGNEMTRYQFTCIEGGGLAQKKVIAVALGQNHTLAVTDEGETFSWGNNAFGQLGYTLPKPSIKDDDPVSTLPRQIFGPLKREIVSGIAASRIHSVVHSASSLYTFGKNEGQLGIVDSDARSLEMQTTPRKIAASLFSSPILSVSAIDGATICLLENREVWVFANYGYARLNFPLDGFTNYFLKESWLATKYNVTPNKVNKITAAGNTICALTTSGEVFTVTISRRLDVIQDTKTSTTNPKQIRGALSQPHRIWSAKSSHMAARDVDVDQDGSIILATEAGSVWRRTKRATLKNATAAGTGDYKPKDYKFLRVPGLTRVIAVRSSGYGAYAAVRKDCDVTKTQIAVDPPALWDNLAPLLSFGDLCRYEDKPDSILDHVDPGTMSWSRPSTVHPLRRGALKSKDLEGEVTDILRQKLLSNEVYDLELGTTCSDIRIPVHEFILSGRSQVFREIMVDYRTTNGDFDVPGLLSITQDGHRPLVLLQGVDFLTVLNLVGYVYTDSVIDLWNVTRQFPTMAAKYRAVRTEVMRVASRLELGRLETAARQMVNPARSMNLDFANALLDASYFNSGDIIIELADGEMTLHSAILCQRCPFFDGLFRGRAGGQWLAGRRTEGSLLRVDLTHIETHLFGLVIRHIYTDAGEELFDEVTSEDLNDFLALDELLDHVMDVMSIANELMIDRLSQICQRLIGRYVNARNVCSLLNAIAPSSVSEFKDAALEYVCLSLEAVLQNGSLDELDEDLLLELDEVVRENQLATLPFARSGRADALLFDKYPELTERIESGKRAKIDAIVLSNKFADNDRLTATSFRAQSLEEISTSPVRQRMRRKASREGGTAESPFNTPQLKGKGSVPDLIFDMSDGEEGGAEEEPIQAPVFNETLNKRSTGTPLGSPETPAPKVESQVGESHGQVRAHIPTPKTSASESREPGRPWGSNPLGSSKLDFKDIMSQASTDIPSNITLGLRAQNKVDMSRSFPGKISQKERKRRQQAQQLGQPIPGDKAEPAAPTVSPWQATSHRKPSVTPSNSPATDSHSQGARTPSTPQLTMRQTIANGGAASRQKSSQTPNQPPRSTSSSLQTSKNRPSSASRPGMSVSTTPIPTPHSVRHIPPPSHSPTSESLHLTMEEILSLQQAEKNYIKDAAAKRSLQEIQQEQEFQQWWDQESKKAILEEEQRKRAEERAARAARGRGRSGRSRGKGKERKDPEGEGRIGHEDASIGTVTGESSSKPSSQQEGGDRGRGKGKGHRGNQGGGSGRGNRGQGSAKERSAVAQSTAGQPGGAS